MRAKARKQRVPRKLRGGSDETAGTSADGKEIIDFTMFIAMPGPEINDGNEIQEIIAQKTGVRVKETWLTGSDGGRSCGNDHCRRGVS